MQKPMITVELLDELVKLGFTNEFFNIVHHFDSDTIERHRNYCVNHSGLFQARGANARVQRRLRLILDSYVAGGYKNMEVFKLLADASVLEVPHVE